MKTKESQFFFFNRGNCLPLQSAASIVCVLMIGSYFGVATSVSLLSDGKDEDAVRLMKEPRNEFDYMLKRQAPDMAEDPDPKERRSNIGSSFIRFGRSRSSPEISAAMRLADYQNTKSERHPRGRSDMIIRFGRAGLVGYKKSDFDRKLRSDKFIRFGRTPPKQRPFELNLSMVCSDVLQSNDEPVAREVPTYTRLLMRICEALAVEEDEERKNYEFDDDLATSK